MLYSKLSQFVNHANVLLAGKTKAENKFDYALMKMSSRMVSAVKEIDKKYNDTITDLRIDHASVDEKGNIIFENDKYKYTVAAQKEMLKAMREAQEKRDNTEIKIEPYIVKDVPAELNIFQAEAFAGIVIPEDYQISEPE